MEYETDIRIRVQNSDRIYVNKLQYFNRPVFNRSLHTRFTASLCRTCVNFHITIYLYVYNSNKIEYSYDVYVVRNSYFGSNG